MCDVRDVEPHAESPPDPLRQFCVRHVHVVGLDALQHQVDVLVRAEHARQTRVLLVQRAVVVLEKRTRPAAT